MIRMLVAPFLSADLNVETHGMNGGSAARSSGLFVSLMLRSTSLMLSAVGFECAPAERSEKFQQLN
jgi:hypothetical protein